jgi:hypothetical protein
MSGPEGEPYDLDDEFGFLVMAEKAAGPTGQLVLGVVDPLADAVAWTRRNPVAWRVLAGWARRDADNGVRPSTRLYLCLLRHPFFSRELGLERMPGDAMLVNDHLSSSLARLLKRDFGIEVPTRSAHVDSWKGAP